MLNLMKSAILHAMHEAGLSSHALAIARKASTDFIRTHERDNK